MPMDRRRYPPNWEEISDRIKQRDNHRCQHCGAEDGAILEPAEEQPAGFWGAVPPKPPTYIRLSVAHLDRDETNWEVEDDRLITLCMGCHLRYDANDNHRRRRYGRTANDFQLKLFAL